MSTLYLYVAELQVYRKYFSEQMFYFTYEPNPASAGQPTYYHYYWFFDSLTSLFR